MKYLFYCRWLHLLFNLGVQLVVGLPLEMVHGSLRIAAVYMAGVLAGETFPTISFPAGLPCDGRTACASLTPTMGSPPLSRCTIGTRALTRE